MLTVITIMLVVLAALNAIFTTWATVIDARRASALMRALGARVTQVGSGLVVAQVLAALPGAIVGVPLGVGLSLARQERQPAACVLAGRRGARDPPRDGRAHRSSGTAGLSSAGGRGPPGRGGLEARSPSARRAGASPGQDECSSTIGPAGPDAAPASGEFCRVDGPGPRTCSRQMPTIFIGSAEQIRSDLLERHDRRGLSYLVAGDGALPALAEIASGL